MKHIIIALLLAFAITAPVRADSDERYYQQHRQQFISYQEAAQIALAAFEATYGKAGRIDEVEFEHEFYGDYFEVEIKDGTGREYEVHVDAKTGKVVRGARDVATGTAGPNATAGTGKQNVANDLLAPWMGAVNVAWKGTQGWNGLTVNIARNGRTKMSGTLSDGTKVSANGLLVAGEEWLYVPVFWSKKNMNLAFTLWLPKSLNGQDARSPKVDGLTDAVVGKPGLLKDGAKFRLGAPVGEAKYAEYLPDGVSVSGGAKWSVASGAAAGKVVYARGTTMVDTAKLGANPSGLKLTYNAKDGTFKGSFKAYADVNGKPKATTVNVAGVLVNGIGYGTATVKKAGGVPVTVE